MSLNLDTLVPPRAPTPAGTSAQTKPRLIQTNFGDGYNQISPDGANPFQRSWNLVWDPIEPTEADAIVTFLQAHVGVPFYFTVPREVAPRTVIWATYQRTHPYPVEDSLTLQLQEWFVY